MTPAEMMSSASALLNDTERTIFTNVVLLPYYNLSLQKLQEEFELNNIPVTNETSITLPINANVSKVAFSDTLPLLPADLITIRQLWESARGQNTWTPVGLRTFLPHYLEGQQINQFLIYAWMGQEIRLIPANADNDLKIDYNCARFPPILIEQINTPNLIINVQGFLTHWMAGLAAYFVGENETRATTLFGLASESLVRSTGINVKSLQATSVRRRPFRAAYKQRTSMY